MLRVCSSTSTARKGLGLFFLTTIHPARKRAGILVEKK
jgi:hypothetical protein